MIKYFDAWHQLTAVIFSMANLPSMEFQQRFTFVIDLLVLLQSKVSICKTVKMNYSIFHSKFKHLT